MRFNYQGQTINFPDELSEENKTYYHRGTFYEIEFLEYIRSLRLEGVYIDVGAHIGNHAIYFSRFCQSEKVFSFEPLKAFFNIALANIQRNVPEGKCDLFNFGLSDTTGSAGFSFQDVEEIIHLKTMDDMLGHVENACVIKIDVEGSEAAVIRGGVRTLITTWLASTAFILPMYSAYSTGKLPAFHTKVASDSTGRWPLFILDSIFQSDRLFG